MANNTSPQGSKSMDDTKPKSTPAQSKPGRGNNLTTEARAKGGHNSHSGGRQSDTEQ